MKMDIIRIKETFSCLSRLGVKEVSLPYQKWWELEEQLQLYHNDGGSHTYQKRFDPVMCIKLFGVKIVHEGI